MIYLLLVIGLFVLTYFYDYKGKEQGRVLWFCIALLAFIMIAGLRYRLGTDSIRYERYFERCPDLMNLSPNNFANTRFSPLYILLESIIKTFTDQFIVFQVVHATIVNFVLFFFIYKNTSKIFFAITLYFFTLYFSLNMEVLRESLAVVVFLLAWPSFRDGKWLSWYALSLVGFLFHTSAFFMFLLPLIVVPGIRSIFVFGKRTILVCIVIFAILFVIRDRFFHYVQAAAMLENVAERATVYTKSELATSSMNIFGIIGNTLRFVIYPFVAIYFLKNTHNPRFAPNSRFMSFILMSAYVGIAAMIIPIFYRYNNYFLFFPIIALSEFIFSSFTLDMKRVRLNYLTWVILFIPIFVLDVHFGVMGNANKSGTLKGYMNYYPYASRIDMEKDKDREKLFKYRHAY